MPRYVSPLSAAGATGVVLGASAPVGRRHAARVDRHAAAAVPFVAGLGFATLPAERVWRNDPAEGR